MINGKLTQKDITQHCSSHCCNERDCEYMKEYCRIREFVLTECNECIGGCCRGCKNYK
jgi:hypothetical protein